jgi:hypothetical protein
MQAEARRERVERQPERRIGGRENVVIGERDGECEGVCVNDRRRRVGRVDSRVPFRVAALRMIHYTAAGTLEVPVLQTVSSLCSVENAPKGCEKEVNAHHSGPSVGLFPAFN